MIEHAGIGDGGEEVESPHGPAWQEPYAYRSYLSAASLAAASIESEGSSGIVNRVTFLNFGRTGSEIQAGLFEPRNATADGWAHDRGQLEEVEDVVAGRTIDALIVTVGVVRW